MSIGCMFLAVSSFWASHFQAMEVAGWSPQRNIGGPYARISQQQGFQRAFPVPPLHQASRLYASPSPPDDHSALDSQEDASSSSVQEEIELLDNDARLVDQSFAQLYHDTLPQWLLERLEACGWTHPTRIQKAALDTILKDKNDAVVQAQTGSGKTLAFLLPILANVDPSRAAVQAMIVVPTRELGLQVGRVAKRLAANSVVDATSSTSTIMDADNDEVENENDTTVIATTNATISNNNNKIMIMTVLQGSKNRRQRAWAWAEPPQVVIGTPEELCNMVRLGGIKRYNSIRYLVVDEVDACLLNNAGGMKSNLKSSTLHELLSKYLSPTYDDGTSTVSNPATDPSSRFSNSKATSSTSRPVLQTRQTIFCSATIPQHRHFMKQCVQNQWILTNNPQHVCLRPGEQLIPPTLEHAYMVCASSDTKLAALRRILQKLQATNTPKKVLIFAEPQRPLEEMAQVVANDLEGLIWKEVYGPKEEATASAIVGVLRYEDSLSQRAAAIQGFTGETNVPVISHQWKGRSSTNSGDRNDRKEHVQIRVLFSSDLAARGLDIVDITHVIQFDLAPDADTYVHRSGRTGRFGANGQVISIITPEQEFVLNRLANKLFLEMDCIARQKQKSKK